MNLGLFKKLRFAEIRQDKWQASAGKLSDREMRWLKQRELIFFMYRTIRAAVLFPVLIPRYLVSLARLLDEFERLHFGPLRKIRQGLDCIIDRQTWLINGQNIMLGNFVKLSAFSALMAGYSSTIKIGTNTIIGPGVVIVSFNHGIKTNGVPIRYQEWQDSPRDSIVIGDDVWIGANVIILPGTNIGNGSIIGAGTIIKGTIPPETIVYSQHGQLRMTRRE